MPFSSTSENNLSVLGGVGESSTSSNFVSSAYKKSADALKKMTSTASDFSRKIFDSRAALASGGLLLAFLTLLVWALVFNNKYIYRFTDKYFSQYLGGRLADAEGKPTQRGMVVHAVLFALVTALIATGGVAGAVSGIPVLKNVFRG